MKHLRKIPAVCLMAFGLVTMLAAPAFANTGHINARQDCTTWSVTVTLDHNVAPDRSVDVISTIPGHPGFTGHHYDTTYGDIWTASGSTQVSGEITLNIYYATGGLDSTAHATLTPAEGCEPTTTTTMPTTTTTVPTTTTTEVPVVTTTTTPVPPVVPRPPVPPVLPPHGVVNVPVPPHTLRPPVGTPSQPVPTTSLPRTGANDVGLLLLVAGLLGLGTLLAIVSYKRNEPF